MTESESAAPRVPDSEEVDGGLKLLYVNYIGHYPQVA
jgi:hypothetical protein